MHSAFHMASRSLVPGAVTPISGWYRVHHSVAHRPDGEIFLSRGVELPTCHMENCEVTFELMNIVFRKPDVGDEDD